MAKADAEFVIPFDKDDILKEDNPFSVELLDVDEAEKKFVDFKKGLKSAGCSTVLDHFDIPFSILYDPKKVSVSQLSAVFTEIIYPLLQKTYQYIESVCGLDSSGKQKAMNIVKMTIYLLTLFQKSYEENESSKNDNLISKPKRKVRRRQVDEEESWDWLDQEQEVLCILYSFLNIPFGNVWGTNQPFDETLINSLGGFCYRTLERNDIGGVRNQHIRRSLGQVLGILIKRFNHAHTFLPKAIQVMGHGEASTLAMADVTVNVAKLIEERDKERENPPGLVQSVLMTKMLDALLKSAEDDPSGATCRSAALFLSEVAMNGIELLVPCAPTVACFLAVESYQVRNAALVSLSQMIPKSSGNDPEISLDFDSRENIFCLLLELLFDENAYVRSKLLQLWSMLIIQGAVPYKYYVPVLSDVKHLLCDKSSTVAKNAVHLYTQALSYNPFAGRFNIIELNKEIAKEEQTLKTLLCSNPLPPEQLWKEIEMVLLLAVTKVLSEEDVIDKMPDRDEDIDVDIGSVLVIIAKLIKSELYDEAITLLMKSEKLYPNAPEIRCNASPEDKTSYYVCTLKKIFLHAAQTNPMAVVPEYYENSRFIAAQNEKIKYLQGCCEFLEAIKEGSAVIEELLNGVGTAESLEAIEFFTSYRKFSFENSEKVVASMLNLMGSDKLEVKEAVGAAYKSLYLETSKPTPLERAAQIASRLITLVKGLETSHRSSLEELVHQWWQTGELTKDFNVVLLHKLKTGEDVIPSLILLHMLANLENAIAVDNFSFLKGLLKSNMDPVALEYLCHLLALSSARKINGKPVRYMSKNPLLVTCADILVDKFSDLSLVGYNNMATAVLDLIFKLCFEPEELANKILFRMYEKTKIIEGGELMNKVNQVLLSRLIFICADITFRKYLYCERDVFNALKKCQNGIVVNSEAGGAEDEGDMEADNAVAADDALLDEIRRVYDQVMSDDKGYLSAHIRNITIQVVKGVKGLVFIPELKGTAASALGKFMMVSSDFAEQNISLMVTMMERSEVISVRSNFVFSFGDLLCQHPNVVEPWTQYLYARLGDSNPVVRKHAVVVLCHLMSTEMVKARGGPLAELALRCEENDPETSHRVQRLLTDLARRGNTLTNALPDMIASLSSQDRLHGALSPDVFKSVIGKVLALVRLERQTESLVEKLLARIAECSNDNQADLIAHCVSLLLSGGGSGVGGCGVGTMRRVGDCLPKLLPERLFRPAVLEAINIGIASAIRSTKPNVKEIGLELQDRIQELAKKSYEDDDENQNQSMSKSSPGDKKKDNPVDDVSPTNKETSSDEVFQTRRSSRQQLNSSQLSVRKESSVAEADASQVKENKPAKVSTKRSSRTRGRKKVEEESDEGSPQPTPAKTAKIQKTKKRSNSSDSDGWSS